MFKTVHFVKFGPNFVNCRHLSKKIHQRILWNTSLLGKSVMDFVSPNVKLHNRYWHNIGSQWVEIFSVRVYSYFERLKLRISTKYAHEPTFKRQSAWKPVRQKFRSSINISTKLQNQLWNFKRCAISWLVEIVVEGRNFHLTNFRADCCPKVLKCAS